MSALAENRFRGVILDIFKKYRIENEGCDFVEFHFFEFFKPTFLWD